MKVMKLKILLVCISLLCISINSSAQRPRNVERFNNNELAIYYEVDDYDRMFDHHRLVFENKTNNKMRVTYKVSYSYFGQINGKVMSPIRKLTETRTIYRT